MLHLHHLAGYVVRLINDSPRVEGNNIMVDVDTDHPVQCGIRLATMTSPLRDCESMQEPFVTSTEYSYICPVQELAIIISNIHCYYSSCSRYVHNLPSHLRYLLLAILKYEV